jgi:hypothetical protein
MLRAAALRASNQVRVSHSQGTAHHLLDADLACNHRNTCN